jgi:hypothetical protein
MKTLRQVLYVLAAAFVVAMALGWAGAALGAQATAGPLRVHPANPRYFADSTGRAVLLAGSHTWDTLVDMGPADPPPAFDFTEYLDFLAKHNHNFIRLWAWECTTWNTKANGQEARHHCAPQPWARTGPGQALDGKPKFDLSAFNPEYFTRLRTRVDAARRRGIYVSVMLFEGWAMQFAAGAWESHPFNAANNTAGVKGDVDGDGKGLEVHELAAGAVTAAQEAYVRKVIETVGDLDNVLYEISNENHPASTAWQSHMIRFIKDVEKPRPQQHPVGMTFQYKGGKNATLFESPADWVSPNPDGGYRDDPPPADGRKVVINDTDHLWGIGGSAAWVWKSVTRGHNAIFMDPYKGEVLKGKPDAKFEPVRTAMGTTLRLLDGRNLAAMTPQPALASSGYCLAEAGRAYLVYAPDGKPVTVDLAAAKGDLAAEWFDGSTGESCGKAAVAGGEKRELAQPRKGADVLLVTAK